MSTSLTTERQDFLRKLAEKCPENLSNLKNYLTCYTTSFCPINKKTRDPTAMKELSMKCPSCSNIYSADSFIYRGKLSVNGHLQKVLSIRRKFKRLPTAHTYKRRLFDCFMSKSMSKIFVKCSNCKEKRRFDGASRLDLIQEKPAVIKAKVVANPTKLRDKFQKVSCQFLKKQSDLRNFLEQL